MGANTGPIPRARNRHSHGRRLCDLRSTLLETVMLVQGVTVVPPLTHRQCRRGQWCRAATVAAQLVPVLSNHLTVLRSALLPGTCAVQGADVCGKSLCSLSVRIWPWGVVSLPFLCFLLWETIRELKSLLLWVITSKNIHAG